MIRNRDSRRGSGLALTILLSLGLFVAYPLSVGPAAMVHHRMGPSPLAGLIEKFYAPLEALPKSAKAPLERWVALWEGYDP